MYCQIQSRTFQIIFKINKNQRLIIKFKVASLMIKPYYQIQMKIIQMIFNKNKMDQLIIESKLVSLMIN